MRTMSAALEAAQKASLQQPIPKIEVANKRSGITKLTWEQLHEISQDEKWHDCTMPGDGSLIRITGGPDRQVYVQRVIDPDEDSDYSTGWTQFTNGQQYVVASSSQGSNVVLFIISNTNGWLAHNTSTDYGATWSGWTGILTSGYANGRIAAAHKSNGDVCVIYSANNALYRVKRLSGTWGSAAAWSNSLNSITGIAVVHQGDWNIVVTGTDTNDRAGVWSCILGDGYSEAVDTWTNLKPIVEADNPSISFAYPFLDIPDVFRLSFIEAFSGSEAYSRPYTSQGFTTVDFVNNLWHEPTPFNLDTDYGISMCHSASHAWLSRRDTVWRAPLSTPLIDLTTYITELTAKLSETSGEIQLSLRYDNNTQPEIKLGREIRFSPGLKTPTGDEESNGLSFWIERLSFPPDTSLFEVQASDGWGLLKRWNSRQHYRWNDGDANIFTIMRFVMARAGLNLSALSSSSAIVNQYPPFTIPHGTSGRTIILTLLDMVPDVLFFRGNTGYLKNPQASDSSDYSYHSPPLPSGVSHAIVKSAYTSIPPFTSRVQVFGDGVFTEDFDWPNLDLSPTDLTVTTDPYLNTTAKAHQRGEAILRDADIHSEAGLLVVPMNCVQELYDVIDITEERADLDEAKRRVLGLIHDFNSTKHKYTLTISLGLP